MAKKVQKAKLTFHIQLDSIFKWFELGVWDRAHGRPPWGIQDIHGYPKFFNQFAITYTDLCACCFMSQSFSVLAQTVLKWRPFKVKV
jgi:hypothetical protein